MTSHKLFSNHVIVIANFEQYFISPGLVANFRESSLHSNS